MSRTDVQSLCASVLGLSLATGTIRKIVDRASAALDAAYQKSADAGKFVRRIIRQLNSLSTFLENESVEPTNNRAERALHFENVAIFRDNEPIFICNKRTRDSDRINAGCQFRGAPLPAGYAERSVKWHGYGTPHFCDDHSGSCGLYRSDELGLCGG